VSKKDYELIARAIRMASMYDERDREPATRIAGHVADALARDNARFDRARFLKACEA
jgi:hypothetical protein